MSKTLLLADDSVVIQKLVGLSFANEDIEIVSTDNGDDAVLRAQELGPDVVLADVVMPGKSGYEVCEAIKQNPALAHIPVLLLTGTFEAFDEGRASSAGADGHITKPFEAQALVERVKTVIRNAARPAPTPSRNETSARASSMPSADDLFAEPIVAATTRAATSATTSATAGFFGRTESLDATPSVGVEDLETPLETDFFGDGGEELGATSFSASIAPLPPLHTPKTPVATATSATSAARPAPSSATAATAANASGSAAPAVTAVPVAASVASASDDLGLGLGLEDPVELAPSVPQELDLDSAFDSGSPLTESGLARGSLQPAASDRSPGSSATGSFAPYVAVTDLDEILAEPLAEESSFTLDRRADPLPPAPEPLSLASEARRADELDFGFDVSEQATIAKVDLLEESFSSLLDVSESQLLADSPAAGAPSPAPSAHARGPAGRREAIEAPAGAPLGDFDVSSSDLAASASRSLASASLASPEAAVRVPPPLPQAAQPPPIPAPEDSGFALVLDVVSSEPPLPPTVSPAALAEPRRASEAVAHLSPMLEQHVQEMLEKVAWEAFSDLSETIVKQVMERVERIAWEVIPQMAETLVREEIRKLKGEED